MRGPRSSAPPQDTGAPWSSAAARAHVLRLLGARASAAPWRTVSRRLQPLLHTHQLASGERIAWLRRALPGGEPALAREAWALALLGRAPRADAGGSLHVIVNKGGQPGPARWDADAAYLAGRALSEVHARGGLALARHAPEVRPASLMAAFHVLQDNLRTYLLRRQADGLGQDLFTLALSDGLRSVRRYVAAMEHHFRPAPPRVLCHGQPSPEAAWRAGRGRLEFMRWEHAHAGDPAADLARAWRLSALGPSGVLAMLEGWEEGRARPDRFVVPRMCAWRVVLSLVDTVAALRELQAWADARGRALEAGETQLLLHWMTEAHVRVADAINALGPFTGPARPVSVAEVTAMGALLGTEELEVRGVPRVVVMQGGAGGHRAALCAELARRLRLPHLELGLLAAQALAASGSAEGAAACVVGSTRVLDGRVCIPSVEDAVPVEVVDAPLRQAVEQWLAEHAGTSGCVVDAGAGPLNAPAGAHVFTLDDSDGDGAVRLGPGSVPEHLRSVLRHLVPEPAIPSTGGLSGRPVLFA